METNDFRVIPVTRYVVSHYYHNEERREASCGPMGEFDHLAYAEQAAKALAASIPGGVYRGLGKDDEVSL